LGGLVCAICVLQLIKKLKLGFFKKSLLLLNFFSQNQTMNFYKYQGTGNDFILLDQRKTTLIEPSQCDLIARLCDRRFGIGSDGIVVLQHHKGYDFEMVFYNPDGSQSMCGNGGRCAVAFAKHLKMVGKKCSFLAIDGPHEAVFKRTGKGKSWIELKMKSIQNIENQGNTYVLNTGSPHYVQFVDDLAKCDIVATGKEIRYGARFGNKGGINVNLAEIKEGKITMQTYERGVEAETLSCGTGVTAVALAASINLNKSEGVHNIPISTKGGELSVRFNKKANGDFDDVWLCGPAEMVFSGKINYPK
jgi:diaminopimelate epimerase